MRSRSYGREVGEHAGAFELGVANRLPVIDSNWVVLAQDPKAGAVVDADTFITATVMPPSQPIE